MLTKLTLKNFKKFDCVEIDLSKSVVFVGPNNSGKTTALQALVLWEVGLKKWLEKRKGKSASKQRQGVAINRRDLLALPIPVANLLWKDTHVRVSEKNTDNKLKTLNIRIEISVEGVTNDISWACGFEFDYANEESFYCRPLRIPDSTDDARMAVPIEAEEANISFLPPMSGLSDREFYKQPGEISVLIGQGQTAQVLRNLCYTLCFPKADSTEPSESWRILVKSISKSFGVELQIPVYSKVRSEITMQYKERSGLLLDLSSSGRGLQQVILILTHLYKNQKSLLLLDEPDAHLEVLRQRETFQLINEIARKTNSQLIAASHSEVVLQEAVNLGQVIAFVGKPHQLSTRSSQLNKALTSIGWDQYYQAERTGWILYLEDSTDLAILRAFATTLNHDVLEFLENAFTHCLETNVPQKSRDHFFGLAEAKKNLVGIALFDKLDKDLQENEKLIELMWEKREIENYLCSEKTLKQWASGERSNDDLFSSAGRPRKIAAMQEAINKIGGALKNLGKNPWGDDIKASDDVLDLIFKEYFSIMNLPITFRKCDYHELASLVPASDVCAEVKSKLDAILQVAKRAVPA